MNDRPADLTLLAELVRQVISQQATMHDAMTVIMAIMQRLDGSVAGVVNEIRTVHAQQARLAAGVRALETPAA